MESENATVGRRVPWNKGKLTGQKPPLKLREIWAIRTRLQMASNAREIAMFNLAIDSKLRACDLTRLQVQDVRHGSHVTTRATVMQQKTQRPVQLEITEQTLESFEAWIEARGLKAADFLFPSRLHTSSGGTAAARALPLELNPSAGACRNFSCGGYAGHAPGSHVGRGLVS
ncbi:hypothetical protein [Bordetella sp. BOR01]|uniref:tyrosine-type recombinase/integrase n=1 Tax=Bordetella sp. BOR01 TaxID=2854779 RepID=UPI00351CD02A